MIFGIGTDIVRIERLAQGLIRYKERYAKRILGADEYRDFTQLQGAESGRARFLAKRFAAKEAVAKALGTGFRGGLSLSDIEVVHDELGKPAVRYSARGQRMADSLGAGHCQLSISDESSYAVAFAIIESRRRNNGE